MTDFVDDDLLRRPGPSRELNMGAARDHVANTVEPGSTEIPVHAVSDFNLTRMAKHREQVEDQVATATKELEKLRQRQEDIEHQKIVLEELRTKQKRYEQGKRELIESLNQGLITVEKDEQKTEKLADLLSSSRDLFRERLEELERLNENSWSEGDIEDELNKALVIIEETRTDYTRAVSKMDELRGDASAFRPDPLSAARVPAPVTASAAPDFRDRVRTGFAYSLPLIIALMVLGLFYYLLVTGIL